jgi:hypothetical protein
VKPPRPPGRTGTDIPQGKTPGDPPKPPSVTPGKMRFSAPVSVSTPNLNKQQGMYIYVYISMYDDDDDVYLHRNHSQHKLENYAPYVKYRLAKKAYV